MKKKGFTLIELLAVIVILAVIALIATPLIMNVINDAKKNSFKDSAYGIKKAIEMRVAMEQVKNPDEANIAYKVDVTSDAIDYNGTKPTSGWAYIDVNGKIELYMCDSSFCASKAINSDEITVTSDSDEKETIAGEITRVSGLDVAELTKDGSEGGPDSDDTASVKTLYAYAAYDEEYGGYYGNPVYWNVESYTISDACLSNIDSWLNDTGRNGWTQSDKERYCSGDESWYNNVAYDVNNSSIYNMVRYGIIDQVSYTLGESKANYEDLGRHVFFKYKTDASELYVCTTYNMPQGGTPTCFEPYNYESVKSRMISLFGSEACETNVNSWTNEEGISCTVPLENGNWYSFAEEDGSVSVSYPGYYDENSVWQNEEQAIIDGGVAFTERN